MMVALIAYLCAVNPSGKNSDWNRAGICIFIAYIVFVIGLRSESLGTDTWLYLDLFDAKSVNELSFTNEWLFYGPVSLLVPVLDPLLGRSSGLFVVAMIYAFGIYRAVRLWGGNQWLLLLLFIISGWSFYNSAINVIRSGIAISFTLCAAHYALRAGPWTKKRFAGFILWAMAACSVHGFQFMFVCALLGSIFLPQLLIWLIAYFAMAGAVYSGINPLASLAHTSLVNKRADYYIAAASHYRTGFRWEFFGFNTLMLAAPFYFIVIRGYRAAHYRKLVCYYLICSTLFVSAFYASYSDRVGLMSFFIVPLLAVSPLSDCEYEYASDDFWKVWGASVSFAVVTFIYISSGLS